MRACKNMLIGVLVVVLAFTVGSVQATILSSWDFEEASGTAVLDGVGTNNATIGVGTGSRVATGDFGGSLGQSWSGGTAGIVTDGVASYFSSLTSMSVEAWIKWDGISLYRSFMSSNLFGTLLYPSPTGYRQLFHNLDVFPGVTPTANTWHQYVMTYAGGTMKLYQDAAEISSTSGGALNWSGLTKTGLNSDYTGSSGSVFGGLIDHLSIHNVALSPTEVLANYNSIVPEPSSVALLVSSVIGLLAYAWRKRK